MKKTIAVIILMMAAIPAFAQSTNAPRKGFVAGASAGMSISSVTGDAPEISDGVDITFPNLKLGWMVNPKMAIMLNNTGIAYKQGGKDRSFDGLIPSVQYWAKPNWWISGGFGLGMESLSLYESGSHEMNLGTACQFSTGYEFLRKGRFVFDVQGTLFVAQADTDFGNREAVSFLTGIGINFY